MIAKIAAFLSSLQQGNEQAIEQTVTLELACTVLFCEVMRADGHIQEQEQHHLATVIEQTFSLPHSDTQALIAQALELCEHANDFHRFTSIVNKHYQIQDKIEIIRLLWQLALADNHLDAIEEHTIRRIADLLHLRHSEYISAKSAVITRP